VPVHLSATAIASARPSNTLVKGSNTLSSQNLTDLLKEIMKLMNKAHTHKESVPAYQQV